MVYSENEVDMIRTFSTAGTKHTIVYTVSAALSFYKWM